MSATVPAAAALKRTPLYELHRKLGARLIDFGGWEMPVQYSGILEEHRAVRERVGIFDVSHMGELELTGEGALAAVQWLTPNDVARLPDGRCQYSAFLTERGTFVDDLLVYRKAADSYMLVVNASNTPKDFEWAKAHAGENVGVDLWNFETPDGRSIRKALDFLSPFGAGDRKWPHQQLGGFSPRARTSVLRRAALKYPSLSHLGRCQRRGHALGDRTTTIPTPLFMVCRGRP